MRPRGRPRKTSFTHAEQRRLYKTNRIDAKENALDVFRFYYGCGTCDDFIRRMIKSIARPLPDLYYKLVAQYLQHLEGFHRVTLRDAIERCGLPASIYERAAPYLIR